MAASGSYDDHQKSTASGKRWVKKWVSEDNKVTGGKLSLLKWIREDEYEAMKENMRESERNDYDQKQEHIRETLYLCSHKSCGRTFKDPQSLRKHAHIRETCKHACSYKGCPKTFSLMFNMRNHLKTHYDENYHLCSFNGCNKRFRCEYKLANHINRFHQKNEMRHKSRRVENTSRYRPYKCPFEGCDKDYIHEYKLKIHLRTMHQYGNNVSDMNGDIITCGESSSKNSKPESNKRAKLIVPRASTLDQQSSESMNMMRIQREYENECNEEEEEEEGSEGSEDEDEVDSEETEDDENLSTYIISSRGERETMD